MLLLAISVICMLLSASATSDLTFECNNSYVTFLTDPNGTVSSHGHPGNYSAYTDCGVVIAAPADHVIEVNFTDLDLGCGLDSVRIYDGGEVRYLVDRSQENYTVTNITSLLEPWLYKNASDQLRVILPGDDYHAHIIDPIKEWLLSSGQGNEMKSWKNHATGCLSDSALHDYVIELIDGSTGYRNVSRNETTCGWEYLVQIICSGGESTVSSDILDTVCGDKNPTYVSSTNTIILSFESDDCGHDQGFSFNWELKPADVKVVSWDAWTPWTACSKDCGIQQVRYRMKMCLPSELITGVSETDTEEEYDMSNCTNRLWTDSGYFLNYSIQMSDCHCPVDGQWTGWTMWSNCSATCGEGLITRERSCEGRKHGGRACDGRRKEVERCNTGLHCQGLSALQEALRDEGPAFKASDQRPSARAIGYTEIILVAIILVIMVAIDCRKIIRDLKLGYRNLKSFLCRWKSPVNPI